jgi:hypothetical protein
MSPMLFPMLQLGKSILDRFIPDPAQKAAAELELLKMTQEHDFKQVMAQLEVNAQEAQHRSIFVAGWRPFVGWVCGVGLAYQAIGHNILNWIASMNNATPLPPIDSDLLIYILGAMLGIGGLRTYEKINKVTK